MLKHRIFLALDPPFAIIFKNSHNIIYIRFLHRYFFNYFLNLVIGGVFFFVAGILNLSLQQLPLLLLLFFFLIHHHHISSITLFLQICYNFCFLLLLLAISNCGIAVLVVALMEEFEDLSVLNWQKGIYVFSGQKTSLQGEHVLREGGVMGRAYERRAWRGIRKRRHLSVLWCQWRGIGLSLRNLVARVNLAIGVQGLVGWWC